MRLTIVDRLMLLEAGANAILPGEGSFADMKVASALRDALGFTDAERNGSWQIRELQPGQWAWQTHTPDPDAAEPAIGEEDTRERIPLDLSAEFNIGERGKALIVKGLKALDSAGKLRQTHVGLYEAFVTAEESGAAGEAADITRVPAVAD